MPHMASATAETRAAMYDLVARNVVNVLKAKLRSRRYLKNVEPVMRRLAVAITGLELPAVEKISQSREEDPFQVTIATLLSARTQDATTYAASERLFKKAATPQAMAKLTVKQIEKLIYPVSFYRYKARYIKATCAKLMKDFGGKTPSTMEELLTLPGVGRKTANLVLILAYESRKNICVDTHVHRIANRLGWVTTKTPGRDGAGAVSRDGIAMVAVHQSLPRHLGTERVPAGVSTMPGVRHQGSVPAHRRDGRQQNDAGQLSVGSGLTCATCRPRPTFVRSAGLASVHHRRRSSSRGNRRPIPVPTPPFRGEAPAASSPSSAETLPCRSERREGGYVGEAVSCTWSRSRTTISTHDQAAGRD